MYKGKSVFMASLLSEGVRYIFGNPGTTESPLLDSLTDYAQIQYILALHEGIAVGMADAYALATGKVAHSQRDITAFADFARQNLIAITYFKKDKVVLVPVKMGDEFSVILGLSPDYKNGTWVAFDHDGNVSVNISHQDYLNYKENLSFDQLCSSL